MGGGGQQGAQNTVSEYKPPGYTTSYGDLGANGSAPGPWQQYVQNAQALSSRPYQDSGLPQIAPLNDYQMTAAQGIYDRAINGAPDLNAARGAATGLASGQYMNPYAQNLQGMASGQGNFSPYAGSDTMAAKLASGQYVNPTTQGLLAIAGGQGSQNPYSIDPTDFINATSNDMTRAYQQGIGANLDASAAQAGAFGGSADQQLKAQGAGELARQVGTMSSQAHLAADQQNANLWQQGMGNQLQAAGQASNNYNSNWQNILNGTNVAAGQWQQGINNMFQANQQGAGMYQNDMSNIMGGAALGLQGSGQDMSNFQSLMGAGDVFGQYQQNLLNSMNQNYQTQQMYPYTQNEYLANALARAGGGQGQTVQTSTPPAYSPYSALLGAGLGAYGAYSSGLFGGGG